MISDEAIDRAGQTLLAFETLHGARAELSPLFEGAGLTEDVLKRVGAWAGRLGILEPGESREALIFSLGLLFASMCFDHPVEELSDYDLALLRGETS